MKNSAVLASLLFGAFAVAAPFDKRALVYKTEVVTETLVIYTTVYDDEPATTSSAEGLFYEQPATTTSVEVAPTTSSTPAYTPPATTEESSSVYTPPAPSTTPTPTPEPATTEAAQPTTTTEEAAPPTTTTEEAAPPAATTGSTPTTGQTYSDVDITVYDNTGAYGACGTALHDSDMIVALAKGSWGESTYDVMTGAATNPNCGQKVQIEYNGNTAKATIMDLCPGCTGTNDIDLSRAVWAALGLSESTRLKASWSKIA